MATMIVQAMPEIPQAFIQIGSLGVGGAIALLTLHFYRLDRQNSEERLAALHIACEKRIEELSHDFKTIIQENTESNGKLLAVIERTLLQL